MGLPEMIKMGALSCQVCVPQDWTDEQVVKFAEREYPCGTTCGWVICKEGHRLLGDSHERVPCVSNAGYVHIVLVA